MTLKLRILRSLTRLDKESKQVFTCSGIAHLLRTQASTRVVKGKSIPESCKSCKLFELKVCVIQTRNCFFNYYSFFAAIICTIWALNY